MAWLKENKQLVIASHNQGKIAEIAQLLEPYHIDVLSTKDFNPPITEVEETGSTFAENALLKAHAVAKETGLLALSDDSGLCVEALDGAPGIFSARFALVEGKTDFLKACEKICAELKEKAQQGDKNFNANFICALALAKPSGEAKVFEGRVDGTITCPPRGTKGFGYDPIFVPQGHTHTFAEMEPEKKHSLSHRAHAFAQLIEKEGGNE